VIRSIQASSSSYHPRKVRRVVAWVLTVLLMLGLIVGAMLLNGDRPMRPAEVPMAERISGLEAAVLAQSSMLEALVNRCLVVAIDRGTE